MSFRDDGDALLARNQALEAENERLREENAQLKAPATTTALARKTPTQLAVPREPWYVRGYTVIVWIAAIVVGILTGVL